MKKLYSFLYNFFIILKVACPVISLIYAILWFLNFFNLKFIKTFIAPFDYFAASISNIYQLNFTFEGKIIDMTYIIAASIFILLHYVFSFFASRVIDLYDLEEKRIIKEKSFVEKNINHGLNEDFIKELQKYTKFTILLNVILKPSIETAADNSQTYKRIKRDFYSKLIQTLGNNYQKTTGIISDKLFLVNDNFTNFDEFLMKIIDELKMFIHENNKNDILTDFIISLDATKDNEITKTARLLDKIDSFNYKNKVVSTSAFKVRYEINKEPVFRTIPLGVSRFFEDEDNYSDFELFSLKKKKD